MALRYRLFVLLVFIALCVLTLPRLFTLTAQASPKSHPAVTSLASTTPFGYGMVMANSKDYLSARMMGFNWIMVFDRPGLGFYPNILRRVKATYSDLSNLTAFRIRVVGAASNAEAIQIGNEPNLISEWGNEPNASQYR
jgi:hypothetical protein